MSDISNLGSTMLKKSKSNPTTTVGYINHEGILYMITRRPKTGTDESTGKEVTIAEYSLAILKTKK